MHCSCVEMCQIRSSPEIRPKTWPEPDLVGFVKMDGCRTRSRGRNPVHRPTCTLNIIYHIRSARKFELAERYTGWLKKVSRWFYADMSMKTEKIGGTWTNRTTTEKMKHCLIFSLEIFCQYFLCLNILWLKAVSVGTTITAMQTRMRTWRHYSVQYRICNYRNRTQIMLFVIFCGIKGPTLLKYPPECTAYFLSHPVYTHRESKKETPYSSSYLHQIFTDFKNFFTDTISRKFAMKYY